MKLQKPQTSEATPEYVLSQYLDKWSKKNSKYDYLLFFSAGKASTYLALKLKQMKKGKICLFTVDNGFENKNFTDRIKQTASTLELDYKILTPPAEEFETLFRFIIKEIPFDEFEEDVINPCLFCMSYIWALGMEYAEKNNIPMVVSGQNPAQIGLPPYSEVKESDIPMFIKIVEKYQRLNDHFFRKVHEKVKVLDGYQKNPIIKRILDKALNDEWATRIVFPFQFLDYNVEQIIKTLVEQIGWKPPQGESIETYVSEACQMWGIFFWLEKKLGYKLKERVEFDDDLETGRMSKERYDTLMKRAETFEKDMTLTPEMKHLLKRLKLEKDFM